MGNTPNVRFKGFTEDWEQRKLSEISDFITKGATPTTYGYDWQESGIPFFRNDAIKDNKFSYGDFSYISEEANEALQRSEIHGDDILVAITGDIGKAGIVPKSIEKGNINQHTARVRIIKDAIPYFVYQSLITDKQQKKYQLIKTGLSMPQLSLQQIRDTIILCPSVEEQSMIGECFINLDNLITLHQQKCDETKEFKKYMLQNMFPQKDEKVPKIRFDGFTEDWEQRKVSEMFKVTRGYVLPATDTSQEMTDEMPYPVYSSQTKDNGLMGYYSDYLYEDAITWTTDGANAGTVNFRDGKFYCTNVCGVLLSDKIETSKVIAEALNNVAKRYVSYVGNPKLMNNVMADIQIAVPISKRERDQISSYFSYLDHLITLHQQKCNALKEFKKYMLQNMFPQKGENKCQN